MTLPVAIQSLETLTVEAIIAYRASLRAVEDIEAKMQDALEYFNLRAFNDLEARHVDLLRRLRENHQKLEALLDDLGYVPKVPPSTSFN